MKKLTVILLLTALLSFAALPTATTWELRTAGSDSNGGCYVTGSTGTDFSQQNSAQYTFTDLVLATTTTMTSVSHLFVATDVGNCIHITAGTGFTTGFYQILSISTGIATVDRAAGTMGSTGGTFAVGGAVLVPSTVNANATGGNQVYVKAGTYTFTTTMVISLDSNKLPAFRWIGYTTTRGDNGRATFTTATDSTNLIGVTGSVAENVEFDNFSFTTTASTKFDVFHATANNGYSFMVVNCVFDGFRHAINGDFAVDFEFSPFYVINSEIKNSTSDGIINSGQLIVSGSYIHDNGGKGVLKTIGNPTNGADVYVNSIIKSNTSDGVFIPMPTAIASRVPPIIYSTVFMSNGGDGLHLNNTGSIFTAGIVMNNNIFYSNTGAAVNSTTNVFAPVAAFSNAYGSNGGGNLINVQAGIGDVTLTSNPFVNSASNNFALNSTAGGGAALKAVGYPGVLTIGGTGYIDIGVLQSQGSAGAGVTTTVGIAQ